MDTKWKSKKALIVWIILLIYGIYGIFAVLNGADDYTHSSYFSTQQFKEEIDTFTSDLNQYEINYFTKEQLKKMITVTDEEIREHRDRYGTLTEQIQSIQEQYADKIEEALVNDQKDIAEIYTNERDKKIEDIKKNFTDSDHVREKIIHEKEKQIDERYNAYFNAESLEHLAEEKKVFAYHFTDPKTGKIYTNIPGAENLQNLTAQMKSNLIYSADWPSKIFNTPEGNQAKQFMENEVNSTYTESDSAGNTVYVEFGQLTGVIGVFKNAPNSSVIATIDNYNNYFEKQMIYLTIFITSLFALIVSISKLRKIRVNLSFLERFRVLYEKIPVDIRIIFFVLTALFVLGMLGNFHIWINDFNLLQAILYLLNEFVGYIFWILLLFIQGYLLKKYLNDDELLKADWEHSVTKKLMKYTNEVFSNRKNGTKVFIILSLAFIFGLGGILLITPLALIYIPAFLLIALPILIKVLKATGYYNQITATARHAALGRKTDDLPIKGKNSLSELAEHVNFLKNSMHTSRQAQQKSERLKTELITNVSHDLRTPLTSIITYTDLLKREGITEEERASYLDIIDRKSKRLKVLIDDLFEASKMSSGSMELQKAPVDLIQLLNQSMAEYEEKIQVSQLQFKIQTSDPQIFANVDGQKMWRVFDNLIGNVLKYSLENTRVYIVVTQTPSEVHIEMKNITKFDLGGNVDELIERFKRGDQSRHTEGSGLGLAIAKSIIDLHGGTFDVHLDGDLFKIKIILYK